MLNLKKSIVNKAVGEAINRVELVLTKELTLTLTMGWKARPFYYLERETS